MRVRLHPARMRSALNARKSQVPRRRIRCVLANVVNRQEVVVDDAFDEVEQPPADEHPPSSAPPLIAQRQSVVRRQRM
jgi:hypothetical protein